MALWVWLFSLLEFRRESAEYELLLLLGFLSLVLFHQLVDAGVELDPPSVAVELNLDIFSIVLPDQLLDVDVLEAVGLQPPPTAENKPSVEPFSLDSVDPKPRELLC